MSLLSLPTEMLLQIFSHLPHSDLQQLRLVSKRCLDLGLYRPFLENSQIVINTENVISIRRHLENAEAAAERLAAFPCMVISVPNRDENLEYVLSRIGTGVHSVYIQKSLTIDNLHRMLPNLDEIFVDSTNSETQGYNIFLLELNCFKRLKSFHVNCPEMTQLLLSQLTSLNTALTLEKLTVGRTDDIMVNRLLTTVLCNHASTLTYLDLMIEHREPYDNVMWATAMQQLTKLNTVKLSGNGHFNRLEIIVMCLPFEAPIRHVSLTGLVQTSDFLIELIAHKWENTLQMLELDFCVNITDEGIAKLRPLGKTLRSLNLSYCCNITNVGLIHAMCCSPNTTLTVLNLRSVSRLKEHCIVLLTQNLPNLEELNLENCWEGVTNNALAHMSRHLLRLRVLNLDDCIRISDKGLMGTPECNYAITRLRNIQHLNLGGLRHISDVAIMQAFAFPELRDLKLSYSHKITVAGVEKLVANCPAIERLTICSCLMICDAAVLYIVTGLRRLRDLNLNNCLNLTEKSIDHVQKNCPFLQKLEMNGIDSLEIGEAQQRLLALYDQIKERQS